MSTVDMIIKNGKLVLNGGIIDGGVAIDQGKIVGIAKTANLPRADKVIDASGNFVLPGSIDPHAHLRERQYSFAHNLKTESRSAVTGGVTTVINFLWGGESHFATFEKHRKDVRENSLVDVAFHVLIDNDVHLSEIPQYVERLGITSFKFLMGYKGEEAERIGVSMIDDGHLYGGLKTISTINGAMAMVHAENADLINRFYGKIRKSKDQSLVQWDGARPPICEEEAIRRAVFFARRVNCPIYIVHVSSEAGVTSLKEVKVKNVYGETCPHYLSLTKDMELGVRGKVNPPLRGRESLEALWRAINDGIIDSIGSDHVPHTLKTKGEDFWESPPGLTGIAITLPLLLSRGVNEGRISIRKVVEICCSNPAKIFGLYPNKGSLAVGGDADIVIVDLRKSQRVTPEILNSISDFTPYEGMELKGWPILTIKSGVAVMEGGEVLDERTGKYIFRKGILMRDRLEYNEDVGNFKIRCA